MYICDLSRLDRELGSRLHWLYGIVEINVLMMCGLLGAYIHVFSGRTLRQRDSRT